MSPDLISGILFKYLLSSISPAFTSFDNSYFPFLSNCISIGEYFVVNELIVASSVKVSFKIVPRFVSFEYINAFSNLATSAVTERYLFLLSSSVIYKLIYNLSFDDVILVISASVTVLEAFFRSIFFIINSGSYSLIDSSIRDSKSILFLLLVCVLLYIILICSDSKDSSKSL